MRARCTHGEDSEEGALDGSRGRRPSTLAAGWTGPVRVAGKHVVNSVLACRAAFRFDKAPESQASRLPRPSLLALALPVSLSLYLAKTARLSLTCPCALSAVLLYLGMIPRSLPYGESSRRVPLLRARSLTLGYSRRSQVNFFLATSSLTFQLSVLYPWHITLDEGFAQ